MLRRRKKTWCLFLALCFVLAVPASAADDDLPTPPKSDVPFLIQAGNLTEIEHVQATEERKNNKVTYVIAGAASSARTPLAGPEFVMLSEKINPNDLRLYRFEVSNGRREITFNEKKQKQNPQPAILSVFPASKGLAKLRVDESLERGEYCLTPDGSNDAFCFTIF